MKNQVVKSSLIALLIALAIMFTVVESVIAQAPLPAPKSAGAACSFTTPPNGMPTMPYWKRGSAVTIKWTITGFTGPVKLSLVDYCSWTVQSIIVASTPNTGVYTWNIPNTIPCGIYEVYVQNATGSPVNWCYSANFAITK
jgi:hypothetical protein